MNPDCLRHRLTDDEREFFNANGYLVVEDALDEAMNSRLLAAVDRVDTRERNAANRQKLLSVTNIVYEDPALIDLIDWPTIYPKVWGILGWNTYLYHSHIDVTPPAGEHALICFRNSRQSSAKFWVTDCPPTAPMIRSTATFHFAHGCANTVRKTPNEHCTANRNRGHRRWFAEKTRAGSSLRFGR